MNSIDTQVTLFQTFHKYYQHDEWQNNGTTYENNVITPCEAVCGCVCERDRI